jgi:protease-4
MARNRDALIILIIVVAGIFLFGVASIIVIVSGASSSMDLASIGNKIALVEINGVIEESNDVVRQIKKYQDDNSIKALVLRIESPGGGVAASQEIYEQLLRFRDKDKAIVVSMGSIAASGGYYVACAADTILANPGTVTGSIGVILSYLVYKNLMDKVGLEMQVIKSGELKDVGNPARQLTPKERAMLQSVIDDTYDQFVGVVAERRSMDIDDVKKLADGSIFTGNQALDNGLVDKLGTLDDAISLAGEMGDLGKHPRVVKERKFRRSLLDELLGFVGLKQSLVDHLRPWPSIEYRFIL